MSTYSHHRFRARLNDSTARSIRARVRAGESPRTLALEYGVGVTAIYDVLAGRSYRSRLVVDADDRIIESLIAAAAARDQSLDNFIVSALRRAIAVP